MAGIVVRLMRNAETESLVRWAEAEAQRTGDSITLFSAWNDLVDVRVELPAGALPSLSVPVICRAGPRSVEVDLLNADPTLLVLSAMELDRRSRLLLHQAACPVVLVPSGNRQVTRRIVVGVCGTSASRAALTFAADLAQSSHVELVVVHAWQRTLRPKREPVSTEFPSSVDARSPVSTLREWVRTTVDPTLVELRPMHGPPLESLLQASEDADLLVMGRHLHGHLAHVWHSALDIDVSRHSTCPVVVVPSTTG